MRRSRHSRSSLAAPWTVFLASLLLLSWLAAGACSKAEPPSEEAPAATTSEAETPAAATSAAETPAPGGTPPAAEEITITGHSPHEWVNQEQKVGPGDTIFWKIDSGKHGLRFPVKADCDLALATMTFNPPLDPIAGGGCQSKTKNQQGETIVSAKVNLVLARDLPYDCVVHKGLMPGVLKPK